MFGVYTGTGILIDHFSTAAEASMVALSRGEGTRVTSEHGAYVVRGGTLRQATRCAPATGRPVLMPPMSTDAGSEYVASTLAALYGGSLN